MTLLEKFNELKKTNKEFYYADETEEFLKKNFIPISVVEKEMGLPQGSVMECFLNIVFLEEEICIEECKISCEISSFDEFVDESAIRNALNKHLKENRTLNKHMYEYILKDGEIGVFIENDGTIISPSVIAEKHKNEVYYADAVKYIDSEILDALHIDGIADVNLLFYLNISEDHMNALLEEDISQDEDGYYIPSEENIGIGIDSVETTAAASFDDYYLSDALFRALECLAPQYKDIENNEKFKSLMKGLKEKNRNLERV